MQRPLCEACNQRPSAINYHRDDVTHYRRRCESCSRKGKGIKPRVPRWQAAGYKKKMQCDKCGFRARYSAQILVYHVDGDINNVTSKNLTCVCRNCAEEITRSDLTWRPGDLTPDL